ncbi:Ethanolamine ammonia-lyase light chain [Methylomagnum ishizawai]|uniref:Ethanolamine ammonia-lyase small subunit n=1 Tax=Methylomagnum ishizawai TaxID=1760988 RepID=A0A1Y6CWQ9_9GAMM|nr:ethanolamine ammonia-lyase subunit EutC [Methylomagnum ishizawai]SMF94680.1 Ethanolamine ammonia-lyase light chain [Methylomagnum ishizawai]
MNDDAWEPLRRFTQARIGLGRAGHALPTGALLDFQLAHARARDAVHLPWNIEGFAAAVRALGSKCLILETPVTDRGEYLRRPDLGRRLTESARARLAAGTGPDIDIALIVTNGLSSTAVEAHGIPLLRAILERYHALGLKPGPVCVVGNGRVAVSDAIGAALKARLAVIVVGERPGLSAADSLGIYLTYGPRPGTTDAGRNCLSNIRPPEGLDYATAAAKLAYLTVEALRRGLSGVDLKDEMVLPGQDGAVFDTLPQL